MTKEIVNQLKSRRAELMAELSRVERAIVALDAAPVAPAGGGKKRGKAAKGATAGNGRGSVQTPVTNGHGGHAMVGASDTSEAAP